MTMKFYKSKLILVVMLLFILAVMASCGDTSAETTGNITTIPITTAPVATTTPTTTIAPVTTTRPVTTTTPTTPENPDDAWMDKVEFLREYSYPVDAYDEETGTYYISIFIQDIHNVGQTNAEAAFAEEYGFFYNPNYGEPWITLGWRFWTQASKEEIEMYARLEEVKKIRFNGVDHIG